MKEELIKFCKRFNLTTVNGDEITADLYTHVINRLCLIDGNTKYKYIKLSTVTSKMPKMTHICTAQLVEKIDFDSGCFFFPVYRFIRKETINNILNT
jgi:hypothetical protein